MNAPRRPSPADMPTRRKGAPAPAAAETTAAPAAVEDQPGPASSRDGYRDLYLYGISTSNLLAHHKLVAFALATHAGQDGRIEPRDQPRLVGLVHDTGLYAGQVAVALTVLRQRGWIRQARRRDRFEVADFILTIPEPLEPRLRMQRAAQQSQPTA
ncbi:hypothetical protein [Streptomyces sp. NPDC059783]|uniref:hypothetical protein n=1 Tax=Streptomyces sp. NPDC059783 TaxID=3346944 RepID=UPI0036664062